MISRAIQFLQKYRVLEGILEKQYANRKNATASPVIEYMHDEDSESVRTDLNMLREIRNILSHNADSDGDPVVEPSEETLDKLDKIIAYVTRLRRAECYGTDAKHVLFAHPTDQLHAVMRRMHDQGFSQVPILNEGAVCGILSLRSVFDFVSENGLQAIDAETLVCDLKEYTRLNRPNGDNFMFVAADTDMATVRKYFNRRWKRNRRLMLILVTRHGMPNEPLLRLITPWDALSDGLIEKGEDRND